MAEIAQMNRLDAVALDDIAWGFLCSEYTEMRYWHASLDHRLDTYLRHRGLEQVVNDGSVYSALLDRVMANFKRARRTGVLDPPHH